MEHPDITKMNRDGYLGTADEDNIIEACEHCSEKLRRGNRITRFNDRVFCDDECLTEAFAANPAAFGAEQDTLE